jgi:ribosomal protein S12 methylthiotransferase accessory factor
VVGRGTGKGIGDQSCAGAVFEAFEHAGARGGLPRQVKGGGRHVLPPAPFGPYDFLYAYARDARRSLPQPTVPFRALHGLYPTRSGRTVHYPRGAVDFGHHEDGDGDDALAVLERYATTNGYAAGATPDDALVHAVNELVERDALSEYLLTSVLGPLPRRRIHGGAPAVLQQALDTVESALSAEVSVVDITAHTGSVVMAHVVPPGSPTALVGMGCSHHPALAYERAVTELHQEWRAFAAGLTFADEGGLGLGNLDPHPLLRRAATIPPPHCTASRSYDSFVRGDARGDAREDFVPGARGGPPVPGTKSRAPVHLLGALARSGFEVFWRPVWHHVRDPAGGDRGVHVVQAIAPGLEQFYAILLGRPLVPVGRLYSPETCTTLLEGPAR